MSCRLKNIAFTNVKASQKIGTTHMYWISKIFSSFVSFCFNVFDFNYLHYARQKNVIFTLCKTMMIDVFFFLNSFFRNYVFVYLVLFFSLFFFYNFSQIFFTFFLLVDFSLFPRKHLKFKGWP